MWWKFHIWLSLLLTISSVLSSPYGNRLSFSIKPGDENVQALRISTSEGEMISCVFKFATKRRSSDDDSGMDKDLSSSVRKPSVQSVLGRLSGICIRKTIDYWKYELCFEGEIKQVHGQVQHNMGRYAGLEGPIQLYDEGTPCESKNEKRGRKTRVEFLCDRQLRIRSVEEVSACSYLVEIGTPIVCGNSEFAVAPSDTDTDGSINNQMLDELWMLELAQVGKGRVECSAKALTGDTRARPERPALTTLEFSRFDFEVTVASDSPTNLQHDVHVVRAPDRVRLSSHEREYSIQSSTRDRMVNLKSGDAFVGVLEFIQLLVRIEEPNSSRKS
jgi:hypothetical protein